MIGAYFATTKNYRVRVEVRADGGVVFWVYRQTEGDIVPEFLRTHHVFASWLPEWMPGSLERTSNKAIRDMYRLQERFDNGLDAPLVKRVNELRDRVESLK